MEPLEGGPRYMLLTIAACENSEFVRRCPLERVDADRVNEGPEPVPVKDSGSFGGGGGGFVGGGIMLTGRGRERPAPIATDFAR